MSCFDIDCVSPLEGPPRFIDGLVASTDPGRSFLITSPNADFVPEIVQGIVDVTLRSDGRYGAVDPVQWPQIFAPGYPYLATIPKRVEDDHPWAPIWRAPAPADFVVLAGTPVTGFGLLSTDFLSPLRPLVAQMSQRVETYIHRRNPDSCRQLRWHELAMRHSLTRLSLMSATFPDQILQLAELQRHWLMAAGYLEYQRRLESLSDICGFSCADRSLMGAWTSDPRSVQILFDAQIPVWFVRYRHLLHAGIRIQRKTTSTPPTMLCSERFPGVDTPVFHGLVGESHLASMMQGGHGYLDISRVPSATVYTPEDYGPGISIREVKAASRSGGLAPTPQAVVRASASQGGRMPPSRRDRPKPYDNRGSTAPHPSQVRGRDKFLEFSHKWMPPPIPSWSQALSGADRSMPTRPSDQLWGYWIPEPALILGPRDEVRQRRYLMNWMRAHPIWLYLLHVPESRASRLPAQFWRSFLNGVPDDPASTTRSGKRLIEIKNIFGSVFREEQFDPETNAAVTWYGQAFLTVPDELAPAVVWEIFELGFRYELLALDRFLRPTGSASRQDEACREDLLAKVFPGDWLRALDSLPSVDSPGFFSPLPRRRITALNALRAVVIRWPGCPTSIVSASPLRLSDSAETIVSFERDLAAFYVDMFFFCSGRAPLVPHLYPA